MKVKLTEKRVIVSIFEFVMNERICNLLKLCIRKSRLIFKLFPDDGLAFVVALF